MADISHISYRQAAFYARWFAEAGIADCSGEKPVNFYDRQPQQTQTRPAFTARTKITKITSRSEPQPAPEPSPDLDRIRADAEKSAYQANDLAALRDALLQFDGCALKKTAHNLVFADGNPEARIMIIGEAPGQEEDRQGLPFVGRAGQLLNKMLAAIGMTRNEHVYITNILPWRPPGNRNPSDFERAACRPFLDQHIALIKPACLVFLGGVAAKELLNTNQGIMRLRGSWHSINIKGRAIDAMPTLHPAYLLRQPAQKALAWRDMMMVKKKYEALNNGDNKGENNGGH